jgi:tRNA(adenine34) deaminase
MEQALIAEQLGEVPVGAVIVHDGQVIASGYNQPIATQDPTAHAEVIALRHAAQYFNNYRLLDCDLYVTLEPCAMCCGAMLHARISRVVYAASDPKTGVVESCDHLLARDWALHQISWQGGVLAAENAARLRAFFKAKRK